MKNRKELFDSDFIYLVYRKPEKIGIQMKADFGIFGGDGRNVYLAEELRGMGYRVITFCLANSQQNRPGMPIPEHFASAATLGELTREARILIGPLPFSKHVAGIDHKKNPSKEENTKLTEEEILGSLQKGQILYAGGIPRAFEEKAKEKGAACRDFLKEKLYLEANAWMTAEGCLAEVIAAWPGMIKNANILVTGYGSCGSAIAELFLKAGATVTVCVRSIVSGWKAYEKGCKVCYYEGLEERIATQDIMINTVPAKVLGETQIKRIRPEALLVEIASAPGGFCKEAVEKSGRTVMDCPGLPGKYSPAGAAKVMAEIITADGTEHLSAPEQRA